MSDVLQDNLATHFLRRTRGAPGSSLTRNGLFDADKVSARLKENGLRWPDVGLVPLAEAAEDSVVLQGKGDIVDIERPVETGHYIFDNVRLFPRSKVIAYRFRDVFLSYDVRFVGRPEFYLFNKEKRLVNGMFFGAAPFCDETEDEIAEPAVLIDDFFVKPNICHFLFDKLPRAYLAEEAFGPRQGLIFREFGYAEEIAGLMELVLRTLGGGKAARGTVRFSDLVLMSDSFNGLRHPGQYGSDRHLEVLARLRARIPADPDGLRASRFMIERAPGLPRNIVNAAEIRALAARFDFAFGDPAAMTVREQLQLFSRIDVLMGVHGAGLTNLAFQPRGGGSDRATRAALRHPGLLDHGPPAGSGV